jgi:two-component system sensor histidine kinase/response regulator
MTDSGQRTGGNGEHVLVVEDSPTQAEHLRYILEKRGFIVSTARNGSAALAMISEVQPALIISDIVMPEMDGYELCRRIKNHDEVCNIRIILLTSLSDPQDVIKGLECGADNFITKPYDEEYLVSRIGYLLENRYEPQDCAALPEIRISFAGKEFAITSSRHQILDLLLSTYETAIQKNRELTKARDELNQLNEQLKIANKDLESFSYTVSHDLRGPLNNIYLSCQTMELLYADSLNEECEKLVRTIYDTAEKMNKLIGTILEFSSFSSQELRQERIDLSGMAHAIIEEYRFNDPGRLVTFHVADGITVEGDTHLLRVVLENLFSNAWKYTGKKEMAVIEFGVTEIDGKPVYFVRDNGAGFDMEQADKLFIPFQRLHSDTMFEGFGIGLSTVQRIIQRHGGRVWAESTVGSGAAFYFTLNL